MTNLFLVYLGGRTSKSNIELHDVQFVAGVKIEDTYQTLCERWFGNVKGLHVDSYLCVKFVDGYRVELRKEPSHSRYSLYFVNFGGYDPNSIAELHQFGLFVADSPEEAKRRAKSVLLVDVIEQHKDDMFDVDDCFVVNEVGEYFVHLRPDDTKQEFKPDWFGYNVIGK
ncbi:MAG: DUF1543 domain-containing protein [Oligoflexia bacterium]|nr:DUF1543 domain-containing protein [Oligoflexia bacterium]